MQEYEMVVGLEVHAELNTASKIYCNCRNAFGLEVNTQVCPVCMGMPGTLPTLNEKVVEYAIKMGHAMNCTINSVCKQDRKNYFYPDLPKAYQISQAEVPLCEHGYLDIMVDGEEKRIGVTRIHIEEDAGKLLHDAAFTGSLVDLNRCGVPLIEIVSEPDIRSSAEAKAYLETIKSILQYLNISDCKMQEGSIRCDVNVSVRKKGSTEFGTRCEMKNVNSFSAAVRGIEYEAKRQIAVLESGGKIVQETRRWDDVKGMSYTMRSKEDAQDYRYFPEPDLLTIVVPEEKIAALKASIPELPNAKIRRYVKEFGLSQVDATLIAEDLERSGMFDACNAIGTCKPKSISNWILSDIAKFTNDTGKKISETPLTPQRLTDLVGQVEKGVISNSAAKKVFQIVLKTGKEPLVIIEEEGMAQNSDADFLEQLAKEVLEKNEKSVTDYKNGKTNALGYLVGQCMKASKGKANPGIVKEIVTRMLTE
ncbi:MAG: Asp-tRNA(Asn)/Glu-tRNA(Gln) amidotransferase subunit GatB [Oscillospiraceae bacterium]|nr:Asp-tRNA(Asn)/Glu-tRNA(Gln) amidotransferase subunit GatB [Oscillospiraceae bacterium]